MQGNPNTLKTGFFQGKPVKLYTLEFFSQRCYVALNAPVPIRTLKLSSVEPVSTWMGDRRGTKLVLLALSWEVCISCNPVRLGGENYWSITWWSLCGHYGLLGGCISCNPGRMGGKKAIYQSVFQGTHLGASVEKNKKRCQTCPFIGRVGLPHVTLTALQISNRFSRFSLTITGF